MLVYFVKNYDIWEQGKDYNVERTLGVKLCTMGVAVPYTVHLDMEAKAKEKAKEKKARAEKVKAAKLLKERAKPKAENAKSKKSKYY